MVTMEFSFGLYDPIVNLAGLPVVPIGPSHPVIDYLRRHAPSSNLTDRLTTGIHIYPLLELEPRFVWIPIAQLALLVVMSIAITLAAVWGRYRWGLGGAVSSIE